MQFDASTPRKENVTIGGVSGLTVPQPFKGQHVCTDEEAHVLNQTIVENVRNNLREEIQKAIGEGKDLVFVQGLVEDYVSNYHFGIGAGGGFRAANPIEAEAMNRARQRVKNAYLKKGIKLKDITAAKVTEQAIKLLAHPEYGPKIQKEAERFVREQQKEAADILDALA